MSDPVRAEIVEGDEMPTELANRPNVAIQPENWTPRMVVSIKDAAAALDERDAFMKEVLSRVEGATYTLPGIDKPALGKSGAERLLNVYGLFSETEDEDEPILDFAGKLDGEPLIVYRRRCTIYRQTGPREEDRFVVARMSGTCTSREVKYRYRNEDRRCPECGAIAILHSKGGGWFCWRKRGGCGVQYAEDDAEITSQTVGRIPNPDVADLTNTILKMADKRAVVAATILATSWSDKVTQDLEEGQIDGPSPIAPADDPPSARNPRARAMKAAGRMYEGDSEPCPADGCQGRLREREARSGKNAGSKFLSCDSWKSARDPGCKTTRNTTLAEYRASQGVPVDDPGGPWQPVDLAADKPTTQGTIADDVLYQLKQAKEGSVPGEMDAIVAVFYEKGALDCLVKGADGQTVFRAGEFGRLSDETQRAIRAEIADVLVPND